MEKETHADRFASAYVRACVYFKIPPKAFTRLTFREAGVARGKVLLGEANRAARWDRANSIGSRQMNRGSFARTHARAPFASVKVNASERARWWAVRSMKDALHGSRARLCYARISPGRISAWIEMDPAGDIVNAARRRGISGGSCASAPRGGSPWTLVFF